jgi:Sulfite exporter TauE/SafE
VASGTGNRLPPGVARCQKCWSSLDLDLRPAYCDRVLPNGWTEPIALLAAFLISALTTPARISGAVLLLPFQVRVLGTPGPSVTPTNLLYNVISTPGALYRYWRRGQTGGRLALVLIAGTVPGVIAGSVIRVELLPGPRVFDLMVATVLLRRGGPLSTGCQQDLGPLRQLAATSLPDRLDHRAANRAAHRNGRSAPGTDTVKCATTLRPSRQGEPSCQDGELKSDT